MRRLDGITDLMDEFEQALEVGDGQGSLVCCSQWSPKAVLGTTQQLNNSNKVTLPVSNRDGTGT